VLVDDISESPILSLIARIFEMRRRGEAVIGLHVGEPDFPTPEGICQAALRSMQEGHTHYVAAQGLPELREAIAKRLSSRHHLPAGAEDVVVLPAKFAVYATFLATLERGSEVLLPDPTYLFEQPIQLVGGRPVYVPLKSDFSLDLDALERAITPRTRLLVLVTPSNPTGRLLTEEEVHAAVDLAHDRGLTLISDETYESLIYEGTHVAPGSLAPRDSPIVTIGSFSKAYSMTGWRAGYAVAPPEIRTRLVKVIEHTLTCVPPFIQQACVWALQNAGGDEDRFREEFRRRRDHLLDRLAEVRGLTCNRPAGAFYVFPHYNSPLDSVTFCERLLSEERLALVPGRAFGPHGEHHVRISYSSPIPLLDEGVDRLARFMSRSRAR
jgi:aspartate/methionine/tyrosine aminotransferase